MPGYLLAILVISLIGLLYRWSSLRTPSSPPPTDQNPAVYTYSPIWRIAIILVGVAMVLAALLLPPDEQSSRNEDTLYRLMFIGAGILCVVFSQFLHVTHRISVYGTYIVCRKFGAEEEIPFTELSSASVAGTGLFIKRTSGRVLSYAVGISRTGELVQRINAGISQTNKKIPQDML